MSDVKVSILEYSILFSLILCLLSVLTVAFGGVRQIETLIATPGNHAPQIRRLLAQLRAIA